MAEPNRDYKPITCSFHDRLEDWAVRRAPVEVVWQDGETQRTVIERIVDVFARDGADHLKLESGITIRLDRLVSVDGMPLRDAC